MRLHIPSAMSLCPTDSKQIDVLSALMTTSPSHSGLKDYCQSVLLSSQVPKIVAHFYLVFIFSCHEIELKAHPCHYGVT